MSMSMSPESVYSQDESQLRTPSPVSLGTRAVEEDEEGPDADLMKILVPYYSDTDAGHTLDPSALARARRGEQPSSPDLTAFAKIPPARSYQSVQLTWDGITDYDNTNHDHTRTDVDTTAAESADASRKDAHRARLLRILSDPRPRCPSPYPPPSPLLSHHDISQPLPNLCPSPCSYIPDSGSASESDSDSCGEDPRFPPGLTAIPAWTRDFYDFKSQSTWIGWGDEYEYVSESPDSEPDYSDADYEFARNWDSTRAATVATDPRVRSQIGSGSRTSSSVSTQHVHRDLRAMIRERRWTLLLEELVLQCELDSAAATRAKNQNSPIQARRRQTWPCTQRRGSMRNGWF